MCLVIDMIIYNCIFQIFDDFVVSGAADKTVLVHNVMVSIVSLPHLLLDMIRRLLLTGFLSVNPNKQIVRLTTIQKSV